MTQPLFLIGPRGCGKTTVGMALADSLNRRFVDTDQWLQSQLNMTVAEIVEREEWAGFRARETAALEAVTAPSTVIATGGLASIVADSTDAFDVVDGQLTIKGICEIYRRMRELG